MFFFFFLFISIIIVIIATTTVVITNILAIFLLFKIILDGLIFSSRMNITIISIIIFHILLNNGILLTNLFFLILNITDAYIIGQINLILLPIFDHHLIVVIILFNETDQLSFPVQKHKHSSHSIIIDILQHNLHIFVFLLRLVIKHQLIIEPIFLLIHEQIYIVQLINIYLIIFHTLTPQFILIKLH